MEAEYSKVAYRKQIERLDSGADSRGSPEENRCFFGKVLMCVSIVNKLATGILQRQAIATDAKSCSKNNCVIYLYNFQRPGCEFVRLECVERRRLSGLNSFRSHKDEIPGLEA